MKTERAEPALPDISQLSLRDLRALRDRITDQLQRRIAAERRKERAS